MNIVGAILCGGSSSRMGRDKAFVEVGGVAMAQRVARALSAAGCNPVVAIGGESDALAEIGLDTVADRWPGEGPFGGVLTALAAYPDADALAVVACDLPMLTAASIDRLHHALAANARAVVAVAVTDRIEPLCAVWRPGAQADLQAMFDGGERRLHAALAALPVVTVPVSSREVSNVNAPADLPD